MPGTSRTAAPSRTGEVFGVLLSLFALLVLVALVTSDPADVQATVGTRTGNFLGPVGAHIADLFLWALGLVSFPLVVLLGWIGVGAVIGRPVRLDGRNAFSALALLVSLAALLHLVAGSVDLLGYPPGGTLGIHAGEGLAVLLSDRGAVLVSTIVLVLSGTLLLDRPVGGLYRFVGKALWNLVRWPARALQSWRRRPRPPEGPVVVETEPVVIAEASNSQEATRREVRPPVEPATSRSATGPVPSWSGSPGEPLSDPPALVAGEDELPSVVEISLRDIPVRGGPPGPRADPEEAPARTRTSQGPRIVVTPQKSPVVQETLHLPRTATQPWVPPPLSLLDSQESRGPVIDPDFLRRNAAVLERKLLDYKVEGKVVEIHPGPVVTMYEFLPAPGVKISQIAALADDLTMALEAVSIRIVAPIPGKGVVGIEVPNAVRETVYLREILASESFTKTRSKLTLALGKDIFGTPVSTDLSRMPHLLIAGATGSGKSVAINAFILSLLYNASPEEVRLILVDPKVVELQVYEGIPHLLLPVVYDPKHAAAALRWAVEEMERRYQLLARYNCRNLQSFNQRVDRLQQSRPDLPLAVDLQEETQVTEVPRNGEEETDPDQMERLPYIVIVLDEFADLMMIASKDVEHAVARLAQKARAAGIHLVMATQRPSKEVITGLIKANFTTRIAFRVSSKIDSRIILDQGGADALLGFGDMLFLRPGSSVLERVHGPFVSDEEVARVTAHLKAQGSPDYRMEILQAAAEEGGEEEDEEQDDLLAEAQAIVMESRRASISFLQRRLKIGYNRSARIMEQLERRGVVGPPDSRGERQVLL